MAYRSLIVAMLRCSQCGSESFVCSADNCLPSHILILWGYLYCTVLTKGTFSLSIATCCPTCLLTNSTISEGHNSLFFYGAPSSPQSAPLSFQPLLMMSQAGSLIQSPSSVKKALLSNRRCPPQSRLCPQSGLYAHS